MMMIDVTTVHVKDGDGLDQSGLPATHPGEPDNTKEKQIFDDSVPITQNNCHDGPKDRACAELPLSCLLCCQGQGSSENGQYERKVCSL